MGAATECSGGSVANTVTGIARLGGRAAFIGRVSDDQFGSIFRHDVKSENVHFPTAPCKTGKATARCLVFVTQEQNRFNPEGPVTRVERTMATYLGSCTELHADDVDAQLVQQAVVLFIEGYLWDGPDAVEAIYKAVHAAKEGGTKVAFALSDALLVERHKETFLDFIANHVDILFCNEHEIGALLGEPDIRRQLYRAKELCELAVVTRSEKGSYILQGEAIHNVDAERVEEVYDVTGAGDLYASGFLFGYVSGYPLEKCGRLGSLCAAEVVKFLGARPVTPLTTLIDKL